MLHRLLEGVFLELICALSKPNTVISCIFPKTHLVARGKEAVELRRFLLNDFGLKAIFSYPERGLFEDVTKGTCVLLGQIGSPCEYVKFISSNSLVEDIDLHFFSNAVQQTFADNKFASVAPGIDGLLMCKKQLFDGLKNGWRLVCREFDDALAFQKAYLAVSGRLVKLSSISHAELPRKRGAAGNSGGSDLLMFDREKELAKQFHALPTIAAMRNAKIGSLIVADGDTTCFEANKITDESLSEIADCFLKMPKRESRQQKKDKTSDEFIALMKLTAGKADPANTILLPRAVRALGRVYVAENKVVVSTNFITLSTKTKNEAFILASWFSTVFYQLICEINAKPQEGMRKMEVRDIEETFVPIISNITQAQVSEIIAEVENIEFLKLNAPVVRKTDVIWAKILFGNSAQARLSEARRLLEFLANIRNENML